MSTTMASAFSLGDYHQRVLHFPYKHFMETEYKYTTSTGWNKQICEHPKDYFINSHSLYHASYALFAFHDMCVCSLDKYDNMLADILSSVKSNGWSVISMAGLIMSESHKNGGTNWGVEMFCTDYESSVDGFKHCLNNGNVSYQELFEKRRIVDLVIGFRFHLMRTILNIFPSQLPPSKWTPEKASYPDPRRKHYGEYTTDDYFQQRIASHMIKMYNSMILLGDNCAVFKKCEDQAKERIKNS